MVRKGQGAPTPDDDGELTADELRAAVVRDSREALFEHALNDPDTALQTVVMAFVNDAVRELIAARKAAELTQEAVAGALRTTQSAVARMEADRHGSMSLRRFTEWALACKVRPVLAFEACADVREALTDRYAGSAPMPAPRAALQGVSQELTSIFIANDNAERAQPFGHGGVSSGAGIEFNGYNLLAGAGTGGNLQLGTIGQIVHAGDGVGFVSTYASAVLDTTKQWDGVRGLQVTGVQGRYGHVATQIGVLPPDAGIVNMSDASLTDQKAIA